MKRTLSLTLLLVWLGTACAAPTSQGSSSPSASGSTTPSTRTLIAAVQSEPKTVAARIIAQGAVSLSLVRRIFNADLALQDDQSNALPYLAESLPQLNTDNWKVFPDGKMETTYHLKPNLFWHDGTPLTADAFVFSLQVYSTPDLGQTSSLPIKLIASVEATDDRTVLIRWKEPYAAAGSLQSLASSAVLGLPPLPRHILGPALESGAQNLLNNSFWTSEYVGLGPYKLDRWEPGSFLEASAFDRHALGAPKIPRIKIQFMPDGNAALASMLSGDIQLASDQALPLAQAAQLNRQWPPGRGNTIMYFNQWLSAHFQGRPEYVNPAALQDIRVRQALAHAIDRPSLNEALYDGQNLIAETFFAPTSDLGRAAEAAATKYPLDPARSAQLMAEAGFTKSAAGFYVGPGGTPFNPDVRGSGTDVGLTSAMSSGWRQAGFDFTESFLPNALVQDLQTKSIYGGLAIQAGSGGEGAISSMGSDSIPRAENNWRGTGIGFAGFSDPEIDRLVSAFGAALDPDSRTRAAIEIVKLYSAEEPSISLYFPPTPWMFVSELTGPRLRPASSNVSWNIYEWELR